MNKKGFAISIILYVVVFLIIAIFYILLGIVKARYSTTNNLKDNVVTTLNGIEHLYTKLNNDEPVSVLRINPSGGQVTVGGVTTTDTIEIVRYMGEVVAIPNASGKAETNNGSYTVTYNANGGDTTPASQNVPLITTYSFARWAPTGDCETYTNGSYTFPASYGTSCTLTAEWNYTNSSQTIVVADNITKLCNIFNGWKSSDGGNIYFGGTNYVVKKDTTMTAQWTLHVEAKHVEYNNSEMGCNNVQCAIEKIQDEINSH